MIKTLLSASLTVSKGANKFDLPKATHYSGLENKLSQDEEYENLLVVSPYTSRPHLLDLNALSEPQQLLAKALTVLSPVRADYATAPYLHAFNWPTVLNTLKRLAASSNHVWQPQNFYIVVFRSRIPPTTSRHHLGELDQRSHVEATKSGGLLKYWFGVPDEDGRNLATCTCSSPYENHVALESELILVGVWRQHKDAQPGSAGPGHQASMRATADMYSEWRVERLRLWVGDGAAEWGIEGWKD